MQPTTIWTGRGPYAMSWEHFGTLASRLLGRIRQDGFTPDVLCCVARGGLVTAGYLAAALDVDRLHLVRVRRTVGDQIYAEKRAPELIVLTPGRLDGHDRVLIVDDIVGSGATAELVDRHARSAGASDVRLAALVHNDRSSYRARYSGMSVDDWVVFPWEAAEAVDQPLNLGGG